MPIRFDTNAVETGSARVRMTVTMDRDLDAFEVPVPISVATSLETYAVSGDTLGKATEPLRLPAGAAGGNFRVDLSSSALVGLGESARYLDAYPFECAEQRASRALALVLSADLGDAFDLGRANAAAVRASATSAVQQLSDFQCPDGGFTLWPGECQTTNPYLTAYILHVLRTARTLHIPINENLVASGLPYLERQPRNVPNDVRLLAAWGTSQAYAAKVLAEEGRPQTANTKSLAAMAERLPLIALSHLGRMRWPRRAIAARAIRTSCAASRTPSTPMAGARTWKRWTRTGWRGCGNTNVRSTAAVLDGLSRRQDATPFAAGMVRWLLEARHDGRWGSTHENAGVLEAMVAYYRAFEADAPDMIARVGLGAVTLGSAEFHGRSTTAQQIRLTLAELARHTAGQTTGDLTIARERHGAPLLHRAPAVFDAAAG